MEALTKDALRALRKERQRIRYGHSLSQADLDALVSAWRGPTAPDAQDDSEDFAIARPDGSTTGVAGPRWLFHLFGLCHRAAHVGLSAPSGLVVLQRRAPTKADWPDAWDMAVAGHVPSTWTGWHKQA